MKCIPLILSKILIILLFLSEMVNGQGGIGGTVVDSVTREPLPFVNIIYNRQGNGVITDKDGTFLMQSGDGVEFLEFRFIGYRNKTVGLEHTGTGMFVELSPETYQLDEAVVYPSVNPAHRIIKKVSENRDANHPEKNGPFTYNSYEKVIFDILPDSSETNEEDSVDTAGVTSLKYGRNLDNSFDMNRLLTSQHLFMMETVSSRKFLKPGSGREEVIASRISGLSQPAFTVLARQLQSFSFYDDFITIGAGSYLSPLSKNGTDRYFFLMRDTLLSDNNDTIYVISFAPRDNRNFDGLEGVIYINTDGYAVQNVIAREPAGGDDGVIAEIRQEYEQVDGIRWFPASLSMDITLTGFSPPGMEGEFILQGSGLSVVMNVNINPVLSGADFDEIELEVKEDAHKQPGEVWDLYRAEPLNEREKETYRVIDSIGKAQQADLALSSAETLVTGYIQGRYINTDIRRFLGYNRYEGLRLGAGGITTDNLSRIFAIDGYLAWGIKDKDVKYGAGITFYLKQDKETNIRAGVWHDVTESGGTGYNQTLSLSSSEFFRSYMVSMMDITDGSDLNFSFRAFKYLTGDLFIKRFVVTPAGSYSFVIDDSNPGLALSRFDFTETGLRFRYAYNENFIKTPRGNRFSTGTLYPVLYLNISRGIQAFGGQYNYLRAEARITKTIKTAAFGETSISFEGGIVTRGVPYNRLFAGRASYGRFTVESWQSFGTMRLNEFLSDRFIFLFVKQDFGTLLLSPHGKFRPEFALVHNLGFGTLSYGNIHNNVNIHTFEKGFFEAGLLINNLLRVQLLKYGFGVFYRYGPYAFHETIDNFAFKFTVQFNL